jgi:hypothetical protein
MPETAIFRRFSGCGEKVTRDNQKTLLTDYCPALVDQIALLGQNVAGSNPWGF